MPRLERLTCLAFSGTPKNVRLAGNLPALVSGVGGRQPTYVIAVARTVPQPAQVLEGVQYGNVYSPNNGVELTGTYSLGASVYPAENDVRDGVDYGPTGADFDGDLVLPAEADVKLGVDYGADGTEFEGTYAGGGGGVSRSRVVNV